eukprot:1136845-Pelagomonas_calceolata.AAC.3
MELHYQRVARRGKNDFTQTDAHTHTRTHLLRSQQHLHCLFQHFHSVQQAALNGRPRAPTGLQALLACSAHLVLDLGSVCAHVSCVYGCVCVCVRVLCVYGCTSKNKSWASPCPVSCAAHAGAAG